MTLKPAHTTAAAVLFLSVLAAVTPPANAATLPAATFIEQIQYPVAELSGNDAMPEVLSAVVSEDWRAVDAVASTWGGARPEGDARMAMTIDVPGFYRDWFGGSAIDIHYHWSLEQTGGDPYVGLVPVNITARGFAQFICATGNAGATSEVRAEAAFTEMGSGQGRIWQIWAPKDEAGRTIVGTGTFDETYTAMIEPGRSNRVDLYAGAAGWVAGSGSFAVAAWVDPIIVIDPAFARGDDFQLVFSAGVTPVPLPVGIVLFGSGLVVVAGASRRRN